MNNNLEEQLKEYKTTSSKKVYIWVILFLLISAAAAYFFLLKKEDTAKEVSYNTKKVTRGNLQVIVMATGNLNPTNSVTIGIEVSGTIKDIYVDFNDNVKVGQVLAKLDTTKLKAYVDSSEASLSIVKANLQESEIDVKQKKLNYERTLKMFKQSQGQYPSQNDLDIAKFSYESAQATYVAAQAKVKQAEFNLKTDEDNLAKAVVRSSIKGIVLNRAVEVGQTVTASMSTPTLFTIAKDLSHMDLVVNIDEADIANIKKGLDVSFTVDAYPNKIFKGKIKQVRYNPIEESGVVTYETVALVNNKSLYLRPGMTASAKIVTKELKNTLLVPNSALRFKPTNTQDKKTKIGFMGSSHREKESKDISSPNLKSVYILKNGQPEKITVKTLETDGKNTGIESSEIKAGDPVIVSQKSE